MYLIIVVVKTHTKKVIDKKIKRGTFYEKWI